MTAAGFPHSEILGSRFVCQLPEAYRRLQRPSSAPSAKASTLCPYKLDHKDLQRCSRPLCSSQATTDPPHTGPPPPTTSLRRHQMRYGTHDDPKAHPDQQHPHTGDTTTRAHPETTTNRLFPQDPTACQAHPPANQLRSLPPTTRTDGVLEANPPPGEP